MWCFNVSSIPISAVPTKTSRLQSQWKPIVAATKEKTEAPSKNVSRELSLTWLVVSRKTLMVSLSLYKLTWSLSIWKPFPLGYLSKTITENCLTSWLSEEVNNILGKHEADRKLQCKIWSMNVHRGFCIFQSIPGNPAGHRHVVFISYGLNYKSPKTCKSTT